LAELGVHGGCAPALGTKSTHLTCFRQAEKYKRLLDLGRKNWSKCHPIELLGAFLLFTFRASDDVAAAADDKDAKILADVYHLFRGGSGF